MSRDSKVSLEQISPDAVVPTEWWHRLPDGRLQCDLCPRFCRLRDGQRGLCFVRAAVDGAVVLTTYGRSSGFCVDPIEKKPLHHFLPGTPVLSFGTAGCNLACKFCQNWDISKSREVDTLADRAAPELVARAARELSCASVAFTYNDPVIFLEYAVDVAAACHERGVRTVAVTAGEICAGRVPSSSLTWMPPTSDLKAFSESFYRRICGGELGAVLDTLVYLRHETDVWLEITTLLIPGRTTPMPSSRLSLGGWGRGAGAGRSPALLGLSPGLEDAGASEDPPATLRRARRIALAAGARYVYTGNVRDPEGESTSCHGCGALLIGRDRYNLTAWG